MTRSQHATRLGLLMALAAVLLGWLAAHTEIMFADGLRYIAQAQDLDRGSWADGLLKAVDHPAYPLAIVAAHRALGGDAPDAWQRNAQIASVVAGVLLVAPLYLVSVELFGGASAWLAVVLTFAVPLTGHVLADVLSEGTFLLFWTWGLWAALKFLKEGTFGWLPLMIVFGALAYLSRPEGLLLPAAVVASLGLMPLLRSTRLNWPRWWAAIAFLVVGPTLLVGPYVMARGGLGTKPAIARLLGTAPKSAADAVERQRPLDPEQTTLKTYALAVKAVTEAVRDAATLPLLGLAVVGLWSTRRAGPSPREWLFLGIIVVAALLALVRLHATGGYCSPRHAMVLAFLFMPAAAAGLAAVLGSIAIPGRWLGLEDGPYTAGPAIWALVLGAFAWFYGSALTAPIGAGYGGYRDAAAYLAEHAPAGSPVVDVTGWALYYGGRSGYTFRDLHEALGDEDVRWIVVREAHLRGPWSYCDRLRTLVAGLKPERRYPATPRRGQAEVYVFHRPEPDSRTAQAAPEAPRR